MSTLKNVLILGASGNVGTGILRNLLKDPSLNLVVATRESSKSTFPEQVKVIRTDFSKTSLVAAFNGQDAVISIVGATALADQKTYVDAAIEAGVKRFLPSEFGIDSLTDATRALLPVLNIKAEVLDYIKQKEESGLTWTALFPGLLFDWGLHADFLGFNISEKRATLWGDGVTRFSITNEADLGKAVIKILHSPAETANKILYMQTVCTTQKEILDAFEQQTGVSWTKEYVKTDDMVAAGKQKLAAGDFEGSLVLVQAAGYGGVKGIKAEFETDGELANDLLGIPTGSVEETITAVLRP